MPYNYNSLHIHGMLDMKVQLKEMPFFLQIVLNDIKIFNLNGLKVLYVSILVSNNDFDDITMAKKKKKKIYVLHCVTLAISQILTYSTFNVFTRAF